MDEAVGADSHVLKQHFLFSTLLACSRGQGLCTF